MSVASVGSGSADVRASLQPERIRRILFLSLEFCFSPFSGNGVLARSLVSSLVRRGDADVRVACARPHPSAPCPSADASCSPVDGRGEVRLEIWPVDLPAGCRWKRLDRSGPWREYAAACSDNSGGVASRVEEFRPTDVVAVDWHGMLAWESIRRSLSRGEGLDGDGDGASSSWRTGCARVCYYNFRVYSSSSWGESGRSPEGEPNDDRSEDRFYAEMEHLSCRAADGVVCLADHDRCMLRRLMEDDDDATTRRKMENVTILHPPLREDVRRLAVEAVGRSEDQLDRHLPPEARRVMEEASLAGGKRRVFVTCVARLSPEKSPRNFAGLLRALGGAGFLRGRSLIPVVCGARCAEEYARGVVDDIMATCAEGAGGGGEDPGPWPCAVIDRHLGPLELAALFRRTAFNVHPCIYDAYGMTLVESAAFGVPSLVNGGGRVGATSLLGEGKGCVAIDLEEVIHSGVNKHGGDNARSPVSESLQALLAEPLDGAIQEEQLEGENGSRSHSKLCTIGREARRRALGWDEEACCHGLVRVLDSIIKEVRR